MIELKNICVGYGKGKVLCDLSVSFAKGELTAVIGANGCGKTTLLKTALGLLRAEQGEVILDGVGLTDLKRNEIAKRAAYLAQIKRSPDMTVEQMVLHGRFPYLTYPRKYGENDRAAAICAMDKMGIKAFSEMPVSMLSGGMRQKAYIAMALAQETDYILLDEPTTFLDISNQVSLVRNLRELTKEGKGIVFVMHDLPLAFGFSDKIAVLDKGKIVALGTPEEIYSSGITEKIFGVALLRTPEGGYCYSY
ncbi:MAG: ABC transporter ATP-binding protein [Ruminococcaceae bacterium]|nr:ABC transporter ATP-binding protein [Oscillospiraceae bacterium]